MKTVLSILMTFFGVGSTSATIPVEPFLQDQSRFFPGSHLETIRDIVLQEEGVLWVATILLVAIAVMLSFMESNAAIVGAIAGVATALVSLSQRKAGRAMVVLVTIVALAGTTLAAKEIFRRDWQDAEWLEGSLRHRVEIWNYTVNLIEQKPLAGWGFDVSRAFKKARFADERGQRQLMPLHPHNAPLQILLELGAVGAVIVFALLMLLVRRIEGLSRPARVCGQALFVSTLAIACAAYGLWQNQWLAMMCSTALLIPLTIPSFAKPARSAARWRPHVRTTIDRISGQRQSFPASCATGLGGETMDRCSAEAAPGSRR